MSVITEAELETIASKIRISPFKSIILFMLESHLPLKNIFLFGLDFTSPLFFMFKSGEIDKLKSVLETPGAIEILLDKIDRE